MRLTDKAEQGEAVDGRDHVRQATQKEFQRVLEGVGTTRVMRKATFHQSGQRGVLLEYDVPNAVESTVSEVVARGRPSVAEAPSLVLGDEAVIDRYRDADIANLNSLSRPRASDAAR